MELIENLLQLLTTFVGALLSGISYRKSGRQMCIRDRYIATRVLPQQHRAEHAPCGGLSLHYKRVRRPGKCRE